MCYSNTHTHTRSERHTLNTNTLSRKAQIEITRQLIGSAAVASRRWPIMVVMGECHTFTRACFVFSRVEMYIRLYVFKLTAGFMDGLFGG